MRLKSFLIIYILSVFVFSVVYYVIYQLNSTSFIIEKQYNQNTVNMMKVWDYLDEPEDIESNFPEDIYDFNKSIQPLYDSLKSINDRVKYMEKKLCFVEQMSDSISQIFEKSRSQDIEQKLARHLKQEKDTLNRIQNEIRIILEGDTINGKYIIAKSGLSVLEANLEYRIALKELNFRNMVLENYDSFGDKRIHKTLSELIFQQRVLTDSIFHTKSLYRKIKSETANKILNFQKKRIDQVGYIDFLYFSVMTAFSCNLGDIIPNNNIARLFITLHVLLSIVLISFILEGLSRRYNNRR